MRFRPRPFRFGFESTTRQTARWIINDRPTTLNDKVLPQIPFMIREKRYNLKTKYDKSPAGQLRNLRPTVTRLFEEERIVCSWNRASEVRPYVERLIVDAMRFGDRHRETMGMANFWLLDKALIHKLFKEFVPRYENYMTSFTAIHKLGTDYTRNAMTITEWKEKSYPLGGGGDAILEMRGNPYPPIVRPSVNRPGLLTNMLIDGARLAYSAPKQPGSPPGTKN